MEEETAPIPCVLEGRLAGFLVDKTPKMEQTWRNPEGHEDPSEVPEPAPEPPGSEAGELGAVVVVVWDTTVTSFIVTRPFFTTKSKV